MPNWATHARPGPAARYRLIEGLALNALAAALLAGDDLAEATPASAQDVATEGTGAH